MLQPTSKLETAALKKLKERNVTLEEIAELVYDIQKPYVSSITMDSCVASVKSVLKKREVQNAILTGIELDVLCENKQLSSPLQEIIENDESLYGIDEILALSIVNVYGSIGFTNFGYLDKVKPKIIHQLDVGEGINTFLDDIVGAIAAAAASRIAHSVPDAKDN